MFNETDLDRIMKYNNNRPIIVVMCPNYEERSIHVSTLLSKMRIKRQNIIYNVLCLKNQKNNDTLLEGIKNKNIEIMCKNITKNPEEVCNWITYPDNFSNKAIESLFKSDFLKGKQKQLSDDLPIDILIDVSTIPRSISFSICEILHNYIENKKNIIGKIYFSYTFPEKYSSVHYAQDIGILSGYFSGCPIRKNLNKSICSVIFPSRSGHEGKLLLDELNSVPYDQRHSVFLPIYANNYLYSLELLRANQLLLDGESYTHNYYCSVYDAILTMHDFLENERKELEKSMRLNNEPRNRLYLVAPFGSKIFLPISYFELKKLQKINPEVIDIEICHAKSFQYTSVYSLGIRNINIFEMEVN